MTEGITGLGRVLQARIKRLFDQPLEEDAPPLEILHAALNDIERRVQPAGRGRRVFPYDRVTVLVHQPRCGAPEIEAAFTGFDDRVHARLDEVRCEPPARLSIQVTALDAAPDGWTAGRLYAVTCERSLQAVAAPAAARVDAAARPTIQVDVVRGAASESSYTFADAVISIGRTPDPVDGLGRPRRNRVAFLDAVDGVTETVGRAHARLRFDPGTGAYSVFDEGSSNGTSIVRDGDTIPVPPRDPRGIRLQSGDELQVGRAVLRVTMG